MKKKSTQFKWLVTMLLLMAAMAMPKMAWAKITPTKPSGKGTADSPYQIGTAAELYWFAALVNGDTKAPKVSSANTGACAKLTADITVNTGVLKTDGTLADDVSSFTTWTPIGTKSKPFTGTFDGQGHTISGLYFDNEDTNGVGLFGINGGTIKNVGVIDSYFKGGNSVGGVCGFNYALNATATITNCYNTGTVSGNNVVGGVCGNNYAQNAKATITNCYNTGAVSGNNAVGGVCGNNYALNDTATITNCYNTGTVSGNNVVGCVCGYNVAYEGTATITNCYYNSDKYTGKAVNNKNGTVTDVKGKTTEQFKSGEVCSLLNNGTTDGTQRWYQNLSAEGGDAYPKLNDTDK